MFPMDCVPTVVHKGLFVLSTAKDQSNKRGDVSVLHSFTSSDARVSDGVNQNNSELDLKYFHE